MKIPLKKIRDQFYSKLWITKIYDKFKKGRKISFSKIIFFFLNIWKIIYNDDSPKKPLSFLKFFTLKNFNHFTSVNSLYATQIAIMHPWYDIVLRFALTAGETSTRHRWNIFDISRPDINFHDDASRTRWTLYKCDHLISNECFF